MNTIARFTAIITVALLAPTILGQTHVFAQDDTQRAVENTITKFFVAMGERDIKGIQDVVAKTFVVIEAGDKPKVHIVDAADESALLPPKGNTDLEGIRLSKFQVNTSTSSRGVAITSFTISKPLTNAQLDGIKAILSDEEMPDEERNRFNQAVILKAARFTSKAMLARQDTSWKIVSISVP